MADAQGHYLAQLTTAPIFDDAVFLCEALRLPEGQTEDYVDSQLAMAAREAGIEDPYHFLNPVVPHISTLPSSPTVSSVHSSSMSIHSRETQSTGVTSQPSRTSRDHPYVKGLPAVATPRLGRSSLSYEDCHDTMFNRFRSGGTHHRNSSLVSGATVLASKDSSMPKPVPRKQKRPTGYGLFSMFRRDSTTCPSRCHHGHHTKPKSPRLECGHTLSKYAVRVHVQEALDSREQLAPNCCGTPLPLSVLETVLGKEEAVNAIPAELPSPAYDYTTDSGYSDDGLSSVDLPRLSDNRFRPTTSFSIAPEAPPEDMTPEDAVNLSLALADESFKTMKNEQKDEYARVSMFESNQRNAFLAYHTWTLKSMESRFATTQAEKAKQHAHDLESLDESQIHAEHDLRKLHAQETQNVATALKYMTAYCAGSNPTKPHIAHAVTEEDCKKLSRQLLTQQKLPAKHSSAINVLRARQEKDTKIKTEKQHIELNQLKSEFEREKRTEEVQYLKDLSRLATLAKDRRTRVRCRWDLRFETWRRSWEMRNQKLLKALPVEEFPDVPDGAPLEMSSSLAIYLMD